MLTYDINQLNKTVNETSLKFLENIIEEVPRMIYVPVGVWLTGAHLLWLQGYTGKDCKIGILDSGVDPKHKDLTNVKKHISFVGDEDYTDFHLHGTHVAGTIGANGTLKGVASGADLYDYRVFDESGMTSDNIIEKAIIKATDDGCQVINMSLGGEVPSTSMEKAVKYANEKGSLLVVAAGNDGSNKSWDEHTVSYPANYKSVLSVASVDYKIDKGEVVLKNTKFSNRNSEIDVCAEGYRVLSSIKDGKYGVLSGTSMACPHVSGFAALMQEKSSLVTNNTDHSVCDLYTIVKINTVPINVSKYTEDKKIIDTITGAGIVTAFPEIPIKDKVNFYLPSLSLMSPQFS